VVSKALGEVSEDAVTLSQAETIVAETNLVSRRRMPSSDEVLENGGLAGMPRSPEAAEEAAYAAQHLSRKPGEPWILTINDIIVMTRPPAHDGSQTVYTPTKALVDQYADDWLDGLAKVRQAVVAAAERDGYNVPESSNRMLGY
jgi:hypothetical protein